MEKLFQPKLTDQEVAEGAPIRDTFRKTLLSNQANLTKGLDTFAETPMANDGKALLKFVDKELAWVNANMEVSKRVITTREKEFNESSKTMYDELKKKTKETFASLPGPKQDELIVFFSRDNLANELRQIAQGQMKTSEEKVLKEKNRKLNRSGWEIAVDAWNKAKNILSSSMFFLFILVLALRAGAFAANDNLWRSLPYRILIFIYTVLFFPITVPYYFYREIRGKYSSNSDMIPHMEAVFPTKPYEPTPEPTLEQRFFGYENNEGIQGWLKQKKEDFQMLRQQSLVTDILDQLKEQEKTNSKA